MAWGLWTCPVDCSLPSSQVTKVAPLGYLSGPGVSELIRPLFSDEILTRQQVVGGFIVTSGITVLAAAATYFLSSDAHDGIHDAQTNLFDEIVLGFTRRMGRLTVAYADRFVPSRISSWLAMILGQDRVRRAFSTVSHNLYQEFEE